MPTQNIFDLVDTWNDGATTFTAVKMNVTDTASNAASLLMDLQVGTVSKFSVSKAGSATFGGNITANASASYVYAAGLSLGTAGAGGIFVSGGNAFTVNSSGGFRWSSNANVNVDTNGDLILTRRAAANLRLGAADAAAPVAQTLSVQSVVAGTSNTAGTNLTITGSQGTGTGAGGSIIFQVAPAGSTGTAQNALAAALTIDPTGTVSIGGMTINPGNGATTFLQTFGITMQTTNAFVIRHGNGDGLDVRPVSSGFPNIQLKNASNAIQAGLWGEATNTLALRNSTNAQAFNLYGTYTDASNYRRAALAMTTAGVATLKPEGAGTGASGNVLHISGLPTSNPGPGILWNNAGTPAIGT